MTPDQTSYLVFDTKEDKVESCETAKFDKTLTASRGHSSCLSEHNKNLPIVPCKPV